MEDLCCPLALVRSTCEFVASRARHVRLDSAALAVVAKHWRESALLSRQPPFDRRLHFVDEHRLPLTVQYLFVLDSMNWSFWSDDGSAAFEYHNLAGGLKQSVERDASCLDAQRLASIDGPALRELLNWTAGELPQEAERARVLRQTASLLEKHWRGSALELVQASSGSASKLVSLIVQTFPAFRDEAVFQGRQTHFYKRAQIFCGDLVGALSGRGLGAFSDVGLLTAFADYRVPVVLRQLGILRYSAELAAAVDGKQELPAGVAMEVEIRAFTVVAVERLREALNEPGLLSIKLDWALWEIGEQSIDASPPHHRCRTIFY
jgi:hypothetical protein